MATPAKKERKPQERPALLSNPKIRADLEKQADALLRASGMKKKDLRNGLDWGCGALKLDAHDADGATSGSLLDALDVHYDYLLQTGRNGNHDDFVFPGEQTNRARWQDAEGSEVFEALADIFFTTGRSAKLALLKLGIGNERRRQLVRQCLRKVMQAKAQGATCRQLQTIFVKHFSQPTNAQRADKNRKAEAKTRAERQAQRQLRLKLKGGGAA